MGRDRYPGYARRGAVVGVFEEEEGADGAGDVYEREGAREEDEKRDYEC